MSQRVQHLLVVETSRPGFTATIHGWELEVGPRYTGCQDYLNVREALDDGWSLLGPPQAHDDLFTWWLEWRSPNTLLSERSP